MTLRSRGLAGRRGHDGFVLDGGQPAEAVLASAAVVGAFLPGDDRQSQLGAGGPAAAVEDVLLQQREEALHRGVVPGLTGQSRGGSSFLVAYGVS